MANKIKTNFSKISNYLALLFIVVIFASVNIISFKRYYRKDLSTGQYLTLSPQTLNVLKNLPSDVTIINFSSAQMDPVTAAIQMQYDIDALLEQYRYKSGKKIELKQINPFSDFEASEKIAQKFKITKNESVLIIEHGDQSKIIKIRDMADVDPMSMMLSQTPKIKDFKGESVITNALLEISEGKKNIVYFTTGHGEPDPLSTDDSQYGLSILAARLKSQNMEVKKVNLAETGSIPTDANAIVVLGPRTPFVSTEINLLKNYLENRGHVFLLIPPMVTTGLENILQPYGVTYNNDLVLQKILAITANGGLSPAITDQAIVSKCFDHPAVNWISQINANISLGESRSINVKETDNQPPQNVAILMESSEKNWGETNYNNLQTNTPQFDQKTDHAGPLKLAVAIDTGSVSDGHVNLPGTRVIAMGASTFLINKEIGTLQADLFSNALNWLLDQKQALGITPKIPKEFTLILSDPELSTMTLLIMICIPAILLLTGVAVWFKRRK